MRTSLTGSIALAAALLASPLLQAASPQLIAGVQANWKDLETWSRLDTTSRQNELGLGLQPVGGAVIAFLGNLSLSAPSTPPSTVRVHIAPAYMTNPNVLRRPVAIFRVDPDTESGVVIDISARLIADDATAGGIIQNAIAPLAAADFLRMTRAEVLTANLLGFDVAFHPEQIRAMKDFAARLHLR